MLKGVLHNLQHLNAPDPAYCRGIVVGVVSTLMTINSLPFDRAFKEVIRYCPQNTRIRCFPREWRELAMELLTAELITFITTED